jgi:hypothetical protein
MRIFNRFMNVPGKKNRKIKDIDFEKFFNDIKKRSFSITLKKKDKAGAVVEKSEVDVIKLSTLDRLISEHFGVSMKNSNAFTGTDNAKEQFD